MNTYYTTRDFEFLRNRPVVLETDYARLLASHEKLVEALKRNLLAIDCFWPADLPENEQQKQEDSVIASVRKQSRAALREAEAITKEA